MKEAFTTDHISAEFAVELKMNDELKILGVKKEDGQIIWISVQLIGTEDILKIEFENMNKLMQLVTKRLMFFSMMTSAPGTRSTPLIIFQNK